MKKELLSLLILPILASGILLTSCNKDDNNTEQQTEEQTEQQFQEELDQALSWAQVYGPPTQTLAEEVAARHKERLAPLTTRPVRVRSVNAVPIIQDLSN